MFFFVPKIYYIKWNLHLLKLLYIICESDLLSFHLHCLYFKFLRKLLWNIFVSEHSWILLPGDLGVELRCAIDLLCDLDHALHLIRISKNVRRLTLPTCHIQPSRK